MNKELQKFKNKYYVSEIFNGIEYSRNIFNCINVYPGHKIIFVGTYE